MKNYLMANGSIGGKSGDLREEKVGKILSNDVGWLDVIQVYIYGNNMYKIEQVGNTRATYYLYSCPISALSQDVETIELNSVALELKGHIATWYTALRTIALVGLLSVLVYIGIRIILSSTSAQDKAKYKNMLKDWIVAICILFVLHYIMAFMLNITGNLNQIIKNNVTSLTNVGNTTDDLMNTVRTAVGDIDQNTTWQMAGYTILYWALVILTGIFTIQYLKRVVFMAFLTMIAPMIALTYPLDKIKDGKAQAFSYWLREYIFNCLIQPVHLLLYTILITNVINFATQNMIYAIVALLFMVPAEKFIKDMFGMKSNSPTGTLGAAAGGAIVMSMINKMKGKPPKEQANQAGAGATSNSNGIRTATRNVGIGQNGTTGQNGTAGQNGMTGQNGTEGQNGITGQNGAAGQNGMTGQNGTTGQNVTGTKRNIGEGLKALGKRYIYGPDALKSNVGRFTGIVGAGLAGTIGLAAQVADGDLFENPKKALTETGVAMGAGYARRKEFVSKCYYWS